MYVAYVDESCRHRAGDACVYALAAVLVEEVNVEQVRSAMRDLVSGNASRLHWRHERPSRRHEITSVVAGLPMTGLASVSLYDYTTNVERARRRCLDVLLRALDDRGVTWVQFESRRDSQDRKDRKLFTALRRYGAVSRDLTASWELPDKEPMLWAADAVAGVITWSFGDDTEYLRMLGNQLSLLDAC